MKVTVDSYSKMNGAYNTLFDEWQKIEDMPTKLHQQMNTALLLLDGVLDECKANMVKELFDGKFIE